jgi:hypothetical protein
MFVSLFSRRGTRSHSRTRRPRPLRLQPLEDRSLPSYGFEPLAFLGDAAPGGGTFELDFEPGAINNRGELAFVADTSTGGEGVFLASKGRITALARAGQPAPGGGTYTDGVLSTVSINDQGDVAFDFLLVPVGESLPFAVGTGGFRYSHSTRAVTPYVLPGVTPAPGGETFAGTNFGPVLNNGGDLYFPALVPTDHGIHIPGQPYTGLGNGIYRADRPGTITAVVVPGDPAPGGGTFDFAGNGPWANDPGDVAFAAHVAGEECEYPGMPPQEFQIGCLTSLYVKSASGAIRSIAHQGDPAPGGGVFRAAFQPVMNNRGDVVFYGDLTPAPDAMQAIGIFLNTGGTNIAIARPGTPMPGGGTLVNASTVGGNANINNRGDVTFSGVLSTDLNHDDIPDTGIFVWSHGELQLVARSGTVIPGVGTIQHMQLAGIVIPPPPVFYTNSGARNNDRGQVVFVAVLTDQRVVMLIATPEGPRAAGAAASGSGALLVQFTGGTMGALPGDFTTFFVGNPGGLPIGFAPRGNPGPADRGDRSHSPPMSPVFSKPLAPEQGGTASASQARRSAIDQFFGAWEEFQWGDVLAG